MPSIKECPKEIMTQSSGYVRLPLITNAVLDDERTFPVPLSRALIEDLPEDIRKEICYSYSELDEPDFHVQFDSLFSEMKSYYIKMEKYGEYIEAVSAAGKAFVGSLNKSQPLLEVDGKYFGLSTDAVKKAEPPAVISADERDRFSLIREPWGERLAKQITLVLGRDMVRREEGSFNYYLRHNDTVKLRLALEQMAKVVGRMKAGREQDETIQAFIYDVFTEFDNIRRDVSKEPVQNTNQLVEVKNESLGLSDNTVAAAELPPIINPDERENFALLRVPWGEKLARQMTLVLGRDLVRREAGSFNYLVHRDKEKLQMAMDKLSKATGIMAAHGEMSGKVKAFEDAVYWELSNIVSELEKEEDKEKAAMGEVEKLLEIKDPLQFITSLSVWLFGLGALCYIGFGHFSYWGHRHSEWIDRKLFGDSARRRGRDGNRAPLPDGSGTTPLERSSLSEMLEGGVASEALTAVRTGLDISGDTKYGDAARLSEARKGLDAAKKALEALERAERDATKGRKR